MKKIIPLFFLFSTITLRSLAGGCAFTYQVDSINDLSVSFTYIGWNGPQTYSWDFGDGAGTSTLQNPSYIYSSPGNYAVSLNTLDTNGIPCNYNILVVAGSGLGCSFMSSGPAQVGTPVSFTNTSVGPMVVFQWDFGDSTTSSLQNPTHIFNSAGNFSVCLTTTDTGGTTCTYCQNSTIVPGPGTGCSAAFQYSSTGLTTYFIENSVVTNLPAMLYTWDFGDGGSSNTRYPVHTYSAPGSYNACLIVTDNASCIDSICQMVNVDTIPPAGCNSNFIFTQTQSYSIAIVNTSYGATPSYLWDFGDGSSSTLAYPSHTYTSTGSYWICLSLTDSTGCTSNFCDSLNVDSNGNISSKTATGFTVNIIHASDLVLSTGQIENSKISISNNPTREFFVINVGDRGDYKFNLHSITGTLCKTGRLIPGQNEIDLLQLSGGIYILDVRSEIGERECWKIVKE